MDDSTEMDRVLTYLVAAAGVALSFAEAVVPHIPGHKLVFATLAAGLAPYLVLVAFSDLIRGPALLVPAALVLVLDAVVTVGDRFLGWTGVGEALALWAPAWLTLIVLPLGVALGGLLSGRAKG